MSILNRNRNNRSQQRNPGRDSPYHNLELENGENDEYDEESNNSNEEEEATDDEEEKEEEVERI
jgi:hypothetical protein